MAVFTKKIQISTKGDSHIIDITDQASAALAESGLRDGILTAFVPGSTAGLTTIEYEEGLLADLREALERWAPSDIHYRHNEAWGDDNGHSHIRAALLGPSIAVPFSAGKLLLGTWQQMVLIDFDVRPRTRSLIFQIVGE